MAVVINEMHVDVREQGPPPAPAASATAEPKKEVSLGQALEIYHERNKRLIAD
jgi:hypothetical protein